jgi:hypothetical protein
LWGTDLNARIKCPGIKQLLQIHNQRSVKFNVKKIPMKSNKGSIPVDIMTYDNFEFASPIPGNFSRQNISRGKKFEFRSCFFGLLLGVFLAGGVAVLLMWKLFNCQMNTSDGKLLACLTSVYVLWVRVILYVQVVYFVVVNVFFKNVL